MKILEIQDRRRISPNVKMVSKEVLHQFVAWFKAGMGLGLMLFTALITFSALSHGANWFKGSVKQGQLRDAGQGLSPVLPKTDPAASIRVVRSVVVVQKSRDDYRMFREQARLVTAQTFHFFSKMVVWTAPISTSFRLIGIGTDLTDNLSRMMSRLAR